MSNLYVVEESDKWFLSIGKKSPWDNNFYVRIPEFLATIILKYIKRRK